MKLLTSHDSDHHAERELQSTEWAIDITNSATELKRMEQTVDNFENYNYIIIFVLIENKCNNKRNRQWLERHAGGGRETMIQFVVA
jgi:hypothetical protein